VAPNRGFTGEVTTDHAIQRVLCGKRIVSDGNRCALRCVLCAGLSVALLTSILATAALLSVRPASAKQLCICTDAE
jgi:hypothetical protein